MLCIRFPSRNVDFFLGTAYGIGTPPRTDFVTFFFNIFGAYVLEYMAEVLIHALGYAVIHSFIISDADICIVRVDKSEE